MADSKKSMMLKIWGKRNGRLLTPYYGQNYVNERRVTPGHIVEMQSHGEAMQYLECVGFQDDLLMQPRFHNVTLEIDQYIRDGESNDYAATIADFEAGYGRL